MNKRILVIDDEQRIREVVRDCLEDVGGWEAIAATSANINSLNVCYKLLPLPPLHRSTLSKLAI